MSVAAAYSDTALQQLPCSWMKNLENTHPSRITYKYPSIIVCPQTIIKRTKPVKTVYLPPVCKPRPPVNNHNDLGKSARCTVPRPPDNSHTISNRNKHSIHPRTECRCYLIRCSTAVTTLLKGKT